LFARVRLDDGWLERARTVIDARDLPATGAYVTLDDGRRVQVIGHARHANGRLLYLVVRPPSARQPRTQAPDAASPTAMIQRMSLLKKISTMLKREPPTPEELEAQRHAADEVLDKHVSQRGMAVQNYPTDRDRY
jgi:hypothetical protein